jgi:hypothetical protein
VRAIAPMITNTRHTSGMDTTVEGDLPSEGNGQFIAVLA